MRKMPKARKRGLVVQEMPNEILIYDEDRAKAHCLNQTAARVWKYCDGKTTIAAACRYLSRDFGEPVDEKLVWYAIHQFSRDHLLEDQIERPTFMTSTMNRRNMVVRLGLIAVAVPLVTSIIAPTAVRAGGSSSCLPPGQPCTASAQCCSLLCSGGVCA